MMLTATPEPPSDEDCFAAIKAGVDTLPAGAKMFLNSGMRPVIQNLAVYFTDWCFYNRRILLFELGDRESRAAGAFLHQVPRLRREDIPLGQGRRTRPRARLLVRLGIFNLSQYKYKSITLR